MSLSEVIDSVNMILLIAIALLLIWVLLRQKNIEPLEGSLPAMPGEIGVDGYGRVWKVTSHTLDIPSTGAPQHLHLDLVEVRS